MVEENQNQNNQSNSQVVDINLTELKGYKGLDMNDFNEIETYIENVIPKSTHTTDNQGNPVYNYFLDVMTPILQEGTNLRARTFIKFWKDENGEVRYSEKPNSNAYKILKHFKVNDFSELVGQPCKTIVRQDDSGNERLDIYFGQ